MALKLLCNKLVKQVCKPLLLLTCFSLFVACGQSGELTLPDEPKPPVDTTPTSSTPEPVNPQ